MARRKILIAGAGVGGMTSAIALSRAGFDVTVFEQASALAEVGAGLSIQPSATRALDSIGLGRVLRERSDLSPTLSVYHYRTGEPIVSVAGVGKTIDENGLSWHHHLHRADFQSMLAENLAAACPQALVLGHKVCNVRQDDSGVEVEFENGQRAYGDALIASDGVRSTVRRLLFDESTPRFRRQVAYRCLVPMSEVADVLGGRGSGTCIGPGRIFTRYTIRKGTVLNCVGIVQTDDWTGEGWSTPATPEEFLAQYQGWHESITGLIERAPRDTLIKWALYDREPLQTWTAGRVALLGDAAHPILPFLGMGGAMAIEDAIVLARACASRPDNLPSALRAYETVRHPRTKDVLESARAQGEVYQDPDTDNYAKRPRPQARSDLYAYDPSQVAILD